MSGEAHGRLGGYELRGVLGRGGMSTVYRAYQAALDREVAVKVMTVQGSDAPTAAMRERLRREAQYVARLRHPHILAVYDFGVEGDTSYIAMELIGGGTLQTRLGQSLPPREVARVVRQIGEALDYAHARGLVHRDVKPANIFLDGRRAVLADFGIVKAITGDSETQLTQTGLGVGTPEYMAPEQALGERHDGRADLYALGVVLYEALTGRPPYDGTPLDVLTQHIHGRLPDPRQYNPALSPTIAAILARALARQPADRYPTGEALANALDAAVAADAGGATPQYPAGPAPTPARTVILDARPEALPGTREGPLPRRPPASETVFQPIARSTGPLLPPLPDLSRPAPDTPSGAGTTEPAMPSDSARVAVSVPSPDAGGAMPATGPGGGYAPVYSPIPTAEPLSGGSRPRRIDPLVWAVAAAAIVLLLIVGGGILAALGRGGKTTPTATTAAAATATSVPVAVVSPSPTTTPVATATPRGAGATATAAADPAFAQIAAGDAALQEGKFSDAIARYRQALATNPNSALANRQLGLALWIWSHEAGELEYLDRATQLAPNDALAWAYLSFSAIDVHQSERAYAAAQQAVRLDQNLPEALAAVANTYIRYPPNPADPESGLREAREAIARAKLLGPDNLWVLWIESAVLQSSAKPEAAITPLDRMIVQRPTWPTLHYARGAIFRALKRYPEARAAQEQALALDPDYPFALTEQGWLAYLTADYAGARRFFEQALTTTDDVNDTAHIGLAFTLNQLGDARTALLHCQRALTIEPRSPSAQDCLGYVYLQGLERYPEALAAFRQEIALRPTWADGYVGAGRAHAAQSQWSGAEAILRQGLERAREPAYVHYWLGYILFQQERYEEALPPLQQAEALVKDDAGLPFWVGRDLEKLGRYEEARGAYRRALALDPNFRPAQEGLDRIAGR